ncbi:MAG: DNA methyltransferase, partial [Eubacteriales bacterium]
MSAFQSKLAGLTFLDPACGSGNFLTETYLSLRKLENEVLRCSTDQISMDMEGIIQVSIGQFYGIEINDFAVTVAKTALWIAESQMMKETEDVVHMPLDFLPLKSYANIVESNALRLDWESVVPKDQLNYIMGNPPFVGQTFRNKEQAEEIKAVFANNSKAGKLDYVAA